MAQATILAAAKTAATSTDLTVASAATATLGIFTDSTGGIPATEGVRVYQDTPSEDLLIGTLDGAHPVMTIPGPGTYRCKRGITTTNIGVFTEGA